MEIESNIIDDLTTDQPAARNMLRKFRDNGFDGDDERVGLALGRPASEIRDMVNGDLDIDDDLATKVRALAKERGFNLR